MSKSQIRKNEMAARKAHAQTIYSGPVKAFHCRVDGDGQGVICYADCAYEAADDYVSGGDWGDSGEPVEVTVSWGPGWGDSTSCCVAV